jgi:hypothetical protein
VAYRQRTLSLTTGSAGQTATGTIAFGQPWARIVRVFLKAASSNGWDSASDFTIYDSDYRRVLDETGLDTTGTASAPSTPAGYQLVGGEIEDTVFHTDLTVTVANAGNSKTGTIDVVFEV